MTAALPPDNDPLSDLFAPDEDAVANDTPDTPADSAPATQPLTRREARQREAADSDASTSPTPSSDAKATSAVRQPSSDRARRRAQSTRDYPPREKKSRRGLIAALVSLVVIAALVGSSFYVWTSYEPQIRAVMGWQEPIDYKGKGSGEVVIVINEGDIGSDIAKTLTEAGVTKTTAAFYKLLLTQDPEPVFEPGAYKLAKHMSAKSALKALLDKANRLVNKFVIPEGTALKDALVLIQKGTNIPAADLNAAAADVGSYGLPPEAKSLEGFLFPATYDFVPGTSAKEVLQKLVNRMFQALDSAGVANDNRWHIVVFAALIQREAGLKADYPKVARVFQNRIDDGMLLQSDATVAYGTGNTHTVTTTDAERADAGNPYNTYKHKGWPVGPISNPGDIAIDAALHPADGPWKYFVTWNLDTGETIFSTTFAEHEVAVKKWQAWMRDHPEY